jgi:restriction system protein
MAVPEFNEIKAPALQFFADGKQHRLPEVYKVLSGHFQLTEADLSEVLPSGIQSRWYNRANWACYDLFRAGLLDRPKKGLYVITELGQKIAAQKPVSIDREFLMQFPKFAEFVKKSTVAVGPSGEVGKEQGVKLNPALVWSTPEEQMANLAANLKSNLAAELLEHVMSMDPFRFERLVLDLLLGMGYGGSREEAAIAGKGVNDGGIDGLINEDRLGLDRIYVQAKRWQNSVQRPEIQNFVGALAGQHAHKGIFITTSEFSAGAREYVKNLPQRVILIDGERLAELMIEHNIGVARAYAYEIKRVDSDYFEES